MSSSPQDPPHSASHSAAQGGLSKGVQLSVGALLVAVLIGWYAYTNLLDGSAFTYYKTLDEFAAAGLPTGDRALRVHGYVATESIERDLEGRQVRFVVQNDPPHAAATSGVEQTRLSVVYRSLETPDLFKDGAEVVVEGRLQGPAAAGHGVVFVADNVMAKCPSKFQAQAEGGPPPGSAQAM